MSDEKQANRKTLWLLHFEAKQVMDRAWAVMQKATLAVDQSDTPCETGMPLLGRTTSLVRLYVVKHLFYNLNQTSVIVAGWQQASEISALRLASDASLTSIGSYHQAAPIAAGHA